MTKSLLAPIFGIVFVLVGLLGFVGNPLVGMGGVFEADTVLNLLHLVTGLILLSVAWWAPARSPLWLKTVGIVYLAVAALGFLFASGGSLLGLIAVNDADHWFHVIAGIILVAASSQPA